MTKIINNRPIVFCAIFLVLGMVISVYFAEVYYLFYTIAALLVVFSIVSFFVKPIKKFRFEVIAFLLFFVFGFLYTFYHIGLFNADSRFDGQTHDVSGTVTKINVYANERRGITLSDVKIDGEDIYGCVFFITYDAEITHGDLLSFEADLEFNQFTTANFAEKRTLYAQPDSINVSGFTDNLFYIIADHLKTNILTNVPGDEGGIMVGLLLGYITEIEQKTLANYSLSGINHIFSVSGLHIVFFSSIIGRILSLLRIKGFKNTLISVVSTVFYAGICGFPVCAVRSVIMSGVLSFVRNAGRKYDILNSLFFSLIIVLLIFPQTLFSYGLILSYIAVLGIAVFTFFFEERFAFLPEAVKSSLAVSFAVTLLMTPILFKMWGYTSLITVFMNLLLVPIIDILYTLVVYVSVITSIFPFTAFLWKIPYYVAYFTNSILTELNVSAFTVYSYVSGIMTILYYILLFFACDITNFKKPVKICCVCASFLILLLTVGGVF